MSTKIEWATESWNPITGCSPVSEGCEHCYARRMAKRLRGRCGYPEDDPFKVTFHPDKLFQPMKWKKPRIIFVCSMGDLFHEDAELSWQNKIWNHVITEPPCYHHIFLILTKRPKRLRAFIQSLGYWGDSDEMQSIFPHIWLGVSVENQKQADARIPVLLQIPAERRFVSIEPMLGPIILSHIKIGTRYKPQGKADPLYLNALKGDYFFGDEGDYEIGALDWVIVGGESGPGARPMHPDWPRSVRDQCQEAEVPFFFKQWGEWAPQLPAPFSKELYKFITPKGAIYSELGIDAYGIDDGCCIIKTGKKAAGRLLDGKEWNEYPEMRG